MLAKLCGNNDEHEHEREKGDDDEQCIARQADPLRSLETQGQPTQGTDK